MKRRRKKKELDLGFEFHVGPTFELLTTISKSKESTAVTGVLRAPRSVGRRNSTRDDEGRKGAEVLSR